MSFGNEIKKIYKENKKDKVSVIINDKQQIVEFQKKAITYAEEISEKIRDNIMYMAENDKLSFDEERIYNFWGTKIHTKKHDKRYCTAFSAKVLIDFGESKFEFGNRDFYDYLTEKNRNWNYFIVNDAKILKYLFEKISRNLIKDNIYCVEKYKKSTTWRTRKLYSIPTKELEFKINDYIEKSKKGERTYDITIGWEFAYFL